MQNGVLLILFSMALTPLGDGLSKHLGETQSPFFIVFLRYFTAGLIAVLLALISKSPLSIKRSEIGGLAFRTGLVMGAMTSLIVSLSMIPLANAVGGFLIAPIVATVILVIGRRENLTAGKLAGSIVSFLGAILILRPSGEIDGGTAIALFGGGLLGAFLAATRVSGSKGNPVTLLAAQCLMGSLMLAPFALSGGWQFDPVLFPAALALGLVTAATHFLTVAAYQRTDAATLAPFFYFNLVAAVLVGFVWFGEVPGSASMVGLVAIVAGGLISLRTTNQIGITRRSSLAHELLSNLVFEGCWSCGDLVWVCGFDSVFECDACDDFCEVVKAA